MTKEQIILKLESEIFIAKMHERILSVKDLEAILTYIKQQK